MAAWVTHRWAGPLQGLKLGSCGRWLDSACSSAILREAHPEYSPEKVAWLVDTAKAVRRALEEDTSGRNELWKTLLAAAGLGSFLRT